GQLRQERRIVIAGSQAGGGALGGQCPLGGNAAVLAFDPVLVGVEPFARDALPRGGLAASGSQQNLALGGTETFQRLDACLLELLQPDRTRGVGVGDSRPKQGKTVAVIARL